jgi:hypothetical protein
MVAYPHGRRQLPRSRLSPSRAPARRPPRRVCDLPPLASTHAGGWPAICARGRAALQSSLAAFPRCTAIHRAPSAKPTCKRDRPETAYAPAPQPSTAGIRPRPCPTPSNATVLHTSSRPTHTVAPPGAGSDSGAASPILGLQRRPQLGPVARPRDRRTAATRHAESPASIAAPNRNAVARIVECRTGSGLRVDSAAAPRGGFADVG